MSLTFYMKGKTETSVEYEDKLPEGMTAEEFREKYGVVVWCDYFGCKYNVQEQDTQRTTGTLLQKRGYQPLGKDAGVWRGLCTRGEIGLNYRGDKPECFTSAVRKTGHKDFSSLLQSDGTPYGGNIDSQHASDYSYDVPSSWDARDKAPRRGITKPNIKEFTL
tara:strand:+ start:3421 stop:3909 length:489 start_codon:yes stop_codon:yes gene_type:complete